MRFGGRVDRPAVEARIGRLQDVEGRNPLAVGIGGEEGVVRGAEEPPVVGIGQRPDRREGLPFVASRGLARHAHVDAVDQRALGIARAHPALGEFGDVVGHQREAGAGAGREVRWAAVALGAGDAFEPAEEIAQEVGGLLQALLAELEAGMHVEPKRRLRPAQRAGLVVLNRLVGRLQHPGRGDPEALVQRILERLHALVEDFHFHVDARHLRAEADLAADPDRDRREVRRALGHRIGHQAPEADVIAADRHQHDVNRPLAQLRRAPGLGHALRRDRGAAGREQRQRVARLLGAGAGAAAADEVGQLVELWAYFAAACLAEALARVHFEEEAIGHFGARAGEAREGDRAVAVLERKLDADAEWIAILRAVAVAAQPLRPGLVEGGLEGGRGEPVVALGKLVFHEPPRQDLRIVLIVPGGKAEGRHGGLGRRFLRWPERGDLVAQEFRVIDHLAGGAELHRAVGIAFARRKGIAERHDEKVLDYDLVVGEFAPIRQLDGDRHARIGAVERIGHARDGQRLVAGLLARLRLSAGLARMPIPAAIAGDAIELLGRNADHDRVGVGQDVILLRRPP